MITAGLSVRRFTLISSPATFPLWKLGLLIPLEFGEVLLPQYLVSLEGFTASHLAGLTVGGSRSLEHVPARGCLVVVAVLFSLGPARRVFILE
jgi:hypothetical protein